MSNDLIQSEYLIRRKVFTLFGNKFHVYDGDGNLLLFTKQKAFKLREDIRIYSDETMSEEKLLIQARQLIDFSAAYDVVDQGEGIKVGAARRKGFKSIVRDSWEFLGPNDEEIGRLEEDSVVMALLRRFLSNLIPQKFYLTAQGRRVAEIRQRFNPFIYKLQVHVDPSASEFIDPRLILAGGILVAAIEGRQN